MELIAPISVQKCSPYIGKPVCAVLNDGSYFYGYLHSVDGERLILSSTAEGVGTVSVSAPKAKKQLKEKKDKAQASFYSPYFYPGLFALDLALIALLFAVPFFFFW